MELEVKGNPGQGNQFNDIDVHNPDVYAPSATEVHISKAATPTRLASDFERLRQQILNKVSADTILELKYYITKVPGTKTLEEKLSDGGFSPSSIEEAKFLKELYRKRAQKFRNFPAAQQIYADFFARIKHDFKDKVFKLIEKGRPLDEVMSALHTEIVKPIMKQLNEEGAQDEFIHFSEDHIYGMVYHLTGMCHLNWKNYDNV